jgi:hypothetical protein
VQRLEPRPEIEAQRRALERLLARAEPIARQLKGRSRKHRDEELRALGRKAEVLRERLDQD